MVFGGRYLLLAALGAGGIGTVFKATQLDCDRLVALKIIHAEVAADEDMRKRFIKEARALSQVHHENIVNVYHVGLSDEGLPYISMEFIEGKSIRQLLHAEGKLQVLRAVRICKQLASALSFIHSQGIVHRDIKPENVVIVNLPEPDTVKLIDFGLARFLQEQKSTKTGTLIGSPVYMSPEQCSGKPVDHRSDIYSLCVCFYEMITGTAPFEADNAIGLMYKHINEAVPVLDPGKLDQFDPKLLEVLRLGLAKSPEQRFKTMQELTETFDAVEKVLSSSARVDSPAAGHRDKKTRSSALSIKHLLILPVIIVLISVPLFLARMQTKHANEGLSLPKSSIGLDEISKMLSKGPVCIEYARHKQQCDELINALNNWESSHRSINLKSKGNLDVLRAAVSAENDRLEDAERYAERANIWRVGSEQLMPVTLLLIDMYNRMGHSDKALALIVRTKKFIPSYSADHAMLLRAAGETFWYQKKYDECLSVYEQAEKIWVALTGECGVDVVSVKVKIIRPLYMKGEMKAVDDYVQSTLKCCCVLNSISRKDFDLIVSSSKRDTQPSREDKKLSENISFDMASLAQSFADVGDFTLASEFLQKSRNALLKVNEESKALEKTLCIAGAFRVRGDNAYSFELEKELLPLITDPDIRVSLLAEMALDANILGDYKSRSTCTEQAFQALDPLLEKQTNLLARGSILNTLSTLVSISTRDNMQGIPSNLDAYLSKWLGLAEKADLPVAQQCLLQMRIKSLLYQRKYAEALPLEEKAIESLRRNSFATLGSAIHKQTADLYMDKQAILYGLRRERAAKSTAMEVIACTRRMQDRKAADLILTSLATDVLIHGQTDLMRVCLQELQSDLEKQRGWNPQTAGFVVGIYREAQMFPDAIQFEKNWLEHVDDNSEKAKVYYLMGSDELAQGSKKQALASFERCLTLTDDYIKSNPSDCYVRTFGYLFDCLTNKAELLSQMRPSDEVEPLFDRWLSRVRSLAPNSMLWVSIASRKARWLSRIPNKSSNALSLLDEIYTVISSREFQSRNAPGLIQESRMLALDALDFKTYLHAKRCEWRIGMQAARASQPWIDKVHDNDWQQVKRASLYLICAVMDLRLEGKQAAQTYLLKCQEELEKIPNNKIWKADIFAGLSEQFRDLGRYDEALRIDLSAANAGFGSIKRARFLRDASKDAAVLGKNDLALQYGTEAIAIIDDLLANNSQWLRAGEANVFYDCFWTVTNVLIKQNRSKDAEQLLKVWSEKIHKRAANKFIEFIMYKAEAHCFSRIAGAKEASLRALDRELALVESPSFQDQTRSVSDFDLKFDAQMDRESVLSDQGNFREAITSARCALNCVENTSPEWKLKKKMEAQLWMARDYVKLGEDNEARNCLNSFESIWNSLGIEKNRNELIELLHKASLLYRDMNDQSEQARVLNLCLESRKKVYGVADYPGRSEYLQELELAQKAKQTR